MRGGGGRGDGAAVGFRHEVQRAGAAVPGPAARREGGRDLDAGAEERER